jgi:hypothetical protein
MASAVPGREHWHAEQGSCGAQGQQISKYDHDPHALQQP